MHKPYFPGELSRRYQMLSPTERARINQDIDKRFQARTGITRRLVPGNTADRESVNDWLRVRDEVMAERIGSSPALAAPVTMVSAPTTSQDKARALVSDFELRITPAAFPSIARADIAAGLRARITNPGLINQGQAELCPSASVIYSEAQSHPVAYTQFIIDLYEKGSARLGTWEVKPGTDLKNYKPPADSIAAVDWVPMASIRDSENWFFDYQDIGGWTKHLGGWDMWSGGASSSEVVKWLKKLGYAQVVQKDAKFFTEGKENLLEASRLRDAGSKIILSIDADVLELKASEAADKKPGWLAQANHFVVLTSPVVVKKVGSEEIVEFTVFTWGKERRSIVPNGLTQLPLAVFLRYYYGFVAYRY